MAGHDKTRIVGWKDSDLDEFTCGICQDVLNKPVVTQCCRQSYCRNCIEEWLSDNDTCPNDRQELSVDELIEVPRLVVNVINNMQIRCEMSEKGCSAVISIGQLEQHRNECRFSQCHKCGCRNLTNGHDCFTYMMDENIKLKDMLDNVTRENLSTIDENQKLKEEIQRINNQLATRPANSIQNIDSAIIAAKSHQADLHLNKNIDANMKDSFIQICSDAIQSFNSVRPNSIQLVSTISDKVHQKIRSYKRVKLNQKWVVNVCVEKCYIGNFYNNNHILAIGYGQLVIVISS